MKNGKMKMVSAVLSLAMVIEIGVLYWNSGVTEGINGRADNMKVYAAAVSDDQTILPGDIYDRNKNLIVQTVFDEDENKKSVKKTTYSDGYAYSQLVGFTGNHILYPDAQTTDEIIGSRNDARLMAFLDEDYWGENGIYSTVNIDGTKGQSAVLTIDHDLQMKVFESLSEEMSSQDDIGSAIVMNAKTGEILADVSFPTYDLNDLSSAQQQMEDDAKNTDLDPGYPVTYKKSVAPGSIFKILMSVALIDHGMGDYTVSNSSYSVGGWTCNASGYNSSTLTVGPDDTLDMETALNISSNVYFSKAALELGADALNETAEKFMLTKDSSNLLLDFGNVRFNWDPDVSDDVLAQTGFGQGKTEMSTIYAAMMTQAIANDGTMLKPYMVKSLVDADGKTVYTGSQEVLSEATCKETADIVTEYMESTALECCNCHSLENVKDVFEKYQVAGKTGTAETGDEEDPNNAWYVSFAPADDPQYVVVVNQCRTDKKGFNMMPTVADIYSYLFDGRD